MRSVSSHKIDRIRCGGNNLRNSQFQAFVIDLHLIEEILCHLSSN